MNIKKYKDQQKRKAVGMLRKLLERIENGELIVESSGFWASNVDNRVTFRILAVSRDDEKEIRIFERIS